MSKTHPVKLAVVRTEKLTPHMQRVVFGGEGFVTFLDRYEKIPLQAGGIVSDCYGKLVFLDPNTTYPDPLDLELVREVVPKDAWPVLRTYTIRWVDAEAQELAIDFVVHGDEGYAGPWAAQAKPGDIMHLRGPNGAYAPDPAADWHLFIGDEAAIPAIGASIERLEAGAKAIAFIEVDDASEEQEFVTKGDVELHWLHRGDAEAGSTDLLFDAVRALRWPSGRVHAFVHGESRLLKTVRPHLFTDRGVPRADVSVSGYWRRGNSEESFRVWKSQQTD